MTVTVLIFVRFGFWFGSGLPRRGCGRVCLAGSSSALFRRRPAAIQNLQSAPVHGHHGQIRGLTRCSAPLHQGEFQKRLDLSLTLRDLLLPDPLGKPFHLLFRDVQPRQDLQGLAAGGK